MQHKVNVMTYVLVLKHLLTQPMTAHEAVQLTGIHIVTARRLFNEMHRHKVVHVCEWEQDSLGRDATKVYALGPGKDKKRTAMTSAERTKRYITKKRALLAQQKLDHALGGKNENAQRID